MMAPSTIETVVRIANLLGLFVNFSLVIIGLAMVLGIVELGRIVAHRISIDVIELLARYQSARLDIVQRRLEQETVQLAIQREHKQLRGTKTAWDIEIEQVRQ